MLTWQNFATEFVHELQWRDIIPDVHHWCEHNEFKASLLSNPATKASENSRHFNGHFPSDPKRASSPWVFYKSF